MAAIRENILASVKGRDQFLDGVVALDQERPGITTNDLSTFLSNNNLPVRMSGIDQPISTYDLFVFWHIIAMSIPLGVGNAAHSGPIFLPWHRMFLIRLEEEIQRVLGDSTFGLPYWDWAADGELTANDQWQTRLWSDVYLGEARGVLRSGKLSQLEVRLVQSAWTGELNSITPRPIERRSGLDRMATTLPDKSEEALALGERPYDQAPWNQNAGGHRNLLEGWPRGPRLHNRVHVWIGGDMAPGTSPNDPAFFLNHCFVDRIWEEWMKTNGRTYQPSGNQGPRGHRLDDQMVAIVGSSLTPNDVLDPSSWYSYDA